MWLSCRPSSAIAVTVKWAVAFVLQKCCCRVKIQPGAVVAYLGRPSPADSGEWTPRRPRRDMFGCHRCLQSDPLRSECNRRLASSSLESTATAADNKPLCGADTIEGQLARVRPPADFSCELGPLLGSTLGCLLREKTLTLAPPRRDVRIQRSPEWLRGGWLCGSSTSSLIHQRGYAAWAPDLVAGMGLQPDLRRSPVRERTQR